MKALFKKETITIFAFSLLALIIRGYSFGTGDQMLYLPLFYKMQDPTLFMNDSLFPLIWSHYAPFYHVILFINRFFNDNFFSSFLLLYIVFNFLFFLCVFLLGRQFITDKLTLWLLPFFFIWHIPVGGSALTTTDSVFIPRFVANTGSLFALLFLYQKRYYQLFFLIGLIFLVHPRSSIMLLLLFVPAFLFSNFKKNIPTILKGLVVLGVIMSFFLPYFVPSSSWLSILHLRNTYAFSHLWSWRSWLYLMVLLIPPFFFLWRKTYQKSLSFFDRINRDIFLSALGIFCISFIFTSIFPLVPVISLQLGRIWLVPIWISFFYFASFAALLLRRLSFPEYFIKIGSFLLLIFIVILKRDSFIHLQPSEWIDVQIWAKNHTAKSCTFLVDYYSQGFRVYSQRPTLGEYKDGTLSFYSEEFASSWSEKRNYFNPQEDGFYMRSIDEIQKKYPFSFVVLHNSLETSFKRVYHNNSYSIHQMPTLEQNCTLTI